MLPKLLNCQNCEAAVHTLHRFSGYMVCDCCYDRAHAPSHLRHFIICPDDDEV